MGLAIHLGGSNVWVFLMGVLHVPPVQLGAGTKKPPRASINLDELHINVQITQFFLLQMKIGY